MKVAKKQKLIKYGVRQGSILGTLLFLCYIKSIAEPFSQISKDNFVLIFDDANLKVSSS